MIKLYTRILLLEYQGIIPDRLLFFSSHRANHIDNHVTERTDLPDQLILGSQGTEIFTQELPRVNMTDYGTETRKHFTL